MSEMFKKKKWDPPQGEQPPQQKKAKIHIFRKKKVNQERIKKRRRN
jgi:hypothetical protein